MLKEVKIMEQSPWCRVSQGTLHEAVSNQVGINSFPVKVTQECKQQKIWRLAANLSVVW